MIINPPNDNYPEFEEEPIPRPSDDEIKEYLNTPKWICLSCGLTNFGRNRRCADYKCRKGKQ